MHSVIKANEGRVEGVLLEPEDGGSIFLRDTCYTAHYLTMLSHKNRIKINHREKLKSVTVLLVCLYLQKNALDT